MIRLFISHNQKDKELVGKFIRALGRVLPEKDKAGELSLFCSSVAGLGIEAGGDLTARLRAELKDSDFVVVFVTANYLRSVYCLAEWSVCWYAEKKVLPLVYDRAAYEELLKIVGRTLICVDMDNRANRAEELFAALKKLLTLPEDRERFYKAFGSFIKAGAQDAHLPYVGSGEEYGKINAYCEKYGIRRFGNTQIPADEWRKNLQDAGELKILSTTGAGLLGLLWDSILPDLLASGTDVKILVPDKGSPFCRDVAEVERPDGKEGNFERLKKEFETNLYRLQSAWKAAEKLCPGGVPGHIYLACCETVLRQTLTIANKRGGAGWAWVSMTIPPYMTRDGTPSFEVACADCGDGLMKLLNGHFDAIFAFAQRHGNVVEIRGETAFAEFHPDEEKKETALAEWEKAYRAAQQEEQYRDETAGVLIEVAAQHPLRGGRRPNPEFCRRLDFAKDLFDRCAQRGIPAKIYVPGSRHRCEKIVDKISLSEAGTQYLREKGVPPDCLFGEESNRKYKGEQGVYNSADECYVAAQLFRDGEFGRLVCVCSPSQTLKKELFYLQYGILALCYGIPDEKMYHSPVYEAAAILPNILYDDHDWQGEDSYYGNRTRAERRVEED